MSEELIKALQTVIDKRMNECGDAWREALDLASLSIDDEANEDEDDESEDDESEDDEDDEEPARHPIDVMNEKLHDAVGMMAVARRLLAGRSRAEIHAAFGAPGDWGYGTPIGDALRAFYSAPAPTAPKLTADERIAQAIAAERERAAADLAAMRARTIEECAARLDEEADRYGLLAAVAPAPARADCESYAFVVKVMAEKLRALAIATPATEPAPVDPAAGAL
jgi:hypothetical protein